MELKTFEQQILKIFKHLSNQLDKSNDMQKHILQELQTINSTIVAEFGPSTPAELEIDFGIPTNK